MNEDREKVNITEELQGIIDLDDLQLQVKIPGLEVRLRQLEQTMQELKPISEWELVRLEKRLEKLELSVGLRKVEVNDG